MQPGKENSRMKMSGTAAWKKACAMVLLCAMAAVGLRPRQAMGAAPPGAIFKILHFFRYSDGRQPYVGLAQGADGKLYAPAYGGGSQGFGTIFSIKPAGSLATIDNFNGQDGVYPLASLVLNTDGKFYGTALFGGANNNCDGGGCGTVFRVTGEGNLTTVYSFCPESGCADGESPAGLVRGIDGNFYGVTESGGANVACGYDNHYACGTVFRLTPGGILTTLHSFDGTDGYVPAAAMVQGTDGSFYGTTVNGGTGGSCQYGCGTLFKITPGGMFSSLHDFDGTDGENPSGLIQVMDGIFYGTTASGGAGDDGTIFSFTVSGGLTTLHNFDGADGAGPNGVLQGSNGKLFGTTYSGGANECFTFNREGCGTVFSFTSEGKLSTLHTFRGPDGKQPTAQLTQHTNGIFYGVSAYGGAGGEGPCFEVGCGTVFSLDMGLGQFVETNPAAARVGADVGILGTDLRGATNVTFNGTVAAFKVVAKTLIVAEVPNGATTGTVQVKLSGGTLSSNVPFYVLK